MRHREIDQEADADREDFRRDHRHEVGRDHQRGRVGDDAENARGGKREECLPAQFAAGFRREGDIGIHHIGAGHRDHPGQHVGGDEIEPLARQRSVTYRSANRNTAKSISELTTPISAKLMALRMITCFRKKQDRPLGKAAVFGCFRHRAFD